MLEAYKVADMLGGRPVLGCEIGTLADLEHAVAQGLPKTALQAVLRRVVEGRERRAAVRRGVVPDATLKRRGPRLSAPESERTERLARLGALALDVLGDEADVRAFLAAPHPRLGGRAPLEAATTELGARQVEAILAAVEHGLPA